MAEIYSIEDLVKYGRLQPDALVLEGNVNLNFMKSMEIPFTLKISGNTQFYSELEDGVGIDFTANRAAICCSSNAETLSINNLRLATKSKRSLFKFQRNILRSITMNDVAIDADDVGELGARSINLLDMAFLKRRQQPIRLTTTNTLTLGRCSNYSDFPLFDLLEGNNIRDAINIIESRFDGSGGFMVIGRQDADGITDYSDLPNKHINTCKLDVEHEDLFTFQRTDGSYESIPKGKLEQIF